MSFVSLSGRIKAFTPIVHIEKNHNGQISFADRINHLVNINENVSN
jgi:hypothetical protein